MSGQHAANLLSDILKWRWQEWTPVTQVKAIRYDQDQVQGGERGGLPFGLDQVIDTATGDGAAGVCTPEGVDQFLRFWNPWMSAWSDSPSIFRDQPGAFFLQQLQENPAFDWVNSWHLDENDEPTDEGKKSQDAWDEFCEELQILHKKIARTTGNAARNRGLCPRCKQGSMLQQPGKHGYAETAVCSNTKCAATIDYSKEETAASIRAIMRQYDGQDIYLPLKDLRYIWPGLKDSTLRSWARRGQVATNEKGYRLADINMRKQVPA